MKVTDDYIKTIFEKAKKLEDTELKTLIYRLILERNSLIESITVDNLTTVYNRRILEQVNDYSAVVMCDVDDFKRINDTYGHDVGDKVLRVVAKVLSSHVRFDDIVCRYGGDEFVIIFNGCPIGVVQNRMQSIQETLKNPFRDGSLGISLSVGISERKEGQTLDDNMKEADIAMYKSKELKNNNISSNNITTYDGEKIVRTLK